MEVQRLTEHTDRGREGEAERKAGPCLPGKASGLNGQRKPGAQGN